MHQCSPVLSVFGNSSPNGENFYILGPDLLCTLFFWLSPLRNFECYFQTGSLTKMRANFSQIFGPVSSLVRSNLALFKRYWVKQTSLLLVLLIKVNLEGWSAITADWEKVIPFRFRLKERALLSGRPWSVWGNNGNFKILGHFGLLWGIFKLAWGNSEK